MSTFRDICRLCLQETDPYSSRKIDMTRLCRLWKYYKFDKMDASLYRNHIICDACIDSLKALKLLFFSLKISQIEIDKELKKSGLTKIDLKKSNRYSSLEGQFFVCRLCFKPAKELALHLYDNPDTMLPVDYINKMLKACKISMNFSNTLDPVACNSCWENIQVGFSFRKQLEKINEKISLHSTALNKCVINREDLQKIVELYRFDDPRKELNLLLTKELRYNSTSACKHKADLKHKVESKTTNNEENPNIYKKIVKNGPIDVPYKPVTEYDALQMKTFQPNKTVTNPYHDIDKVVPNASKLDQVSKLFSDMNNQTVTNLKNSNQDFDSNSNIEVCVNQPAATNNIATEKDTTPPYNTFTVRSDLQIKREIISEDEDVYIKSEVLSEHGADGFEDDDVFEEGDYSERREANLAAVDDDACPSLIAMVKNEPNQEDLDVYDIHYVEHFDYGPPVLAPQQPRGNFKPQPCFSDNPYTFDGTRIQIEKVTSLSQNNEMTPKKVKGKKNLSVKEITKKVSKNSDVTTPDANQMQSKTKYAITRTMVTRSASKNKSNMDIVSPEPLKRKLPENNLSNAKKIKKGTAELLNPELIVNAAAQKLIPNNTAGIIDPVSNKNHKKSEPLIKSKSLKDLAEPEKEVIKRNPLNKYNTRSSLKNTKNDETVNKLLNPVIQSKTKGPKKCQGETNNKQNVLDKSINTSDKVSESKRTSQNKTVKAKRKKEFYTEAIKDLPRLEHFEANDYDQHKRLVINLFQLDAGNKPIETGYIGEENASLASLSELLEPSKKIDLHVNKGLNDDLQLEREIPLLKDALENSVDTKLEMKPKRKTRPHYFLFQCDLCDFRTTRQQGAATHKTLHKNNKASSIHQCTACTYKTTSIVRLKSHFKSDHPGIQLSAPHRENVCFSCGKICAKSFNIKCRKCEHRFHPGCFAKIDSSCQHEEDGFEVDHSYCLPSPIKEKQKTLENPPELQKIEPIVPPLSPYCIDINDDTPPPLLERQIPLPMIEVDFKTISLAVERNKTPIRNVSIPKSLVKQVASKNVQRPTQKLTFHSNSELQNISKYPLQKNVTSLNLEMHTKNVCASGLTTDLNSVTEKQQNIIGHSVKQLVTYSNLNKSQNLNIENDTQQHIADIAAKNLVNTSLHSKIQTNPFVSASKTNTELNSKTGKKQTRVTTVPQNVTQTRLDIVQRSPQRLTFVENQQVRSNPCSPKHTLINARESISNPAIFESMYEPPLLVRQVPLPMTEVDFKTSSIIDKELNVNKTRTRNVRIAKTPVKQGVTKNIVQSSTQKLKFISNAKIQTRNVSKAEQERVQKAKTVLQDGTQTRLDIFQRSPQRLTFVEHPQVRPNPCSPKHTLTNASQTQNNPTIFESMYTDLRVEKIPSSQVYVNSQEYNKILASLHNPASQNDLASKTVNPTQTKNFKSDSGVNLVQNKSFQNTYESYMVSAFGFQKNISQRQTSEDLKKVQSTSTKQNRVTMMSEAANSEHSRTNQVRHVGALVKPMIKSNVSQTTVNDVETQISDPKQIAKKNPVAIDNVQKRQLTSELIHTSTKNLNLPQIPRIIHLEKTANNTPVTNITQTGSSTGLKRVLYPLKKAVTKAQDASQPLKRQLMSAQRTLCRTERPFKKIPVVNPTHSSSSAGLKRVIYPLRKPVSEQQESKKANFQRVKVLKVPSGWVQNIRQQSSPPDINTLEYLNKSTCFDEKSKKIKQEVLDSFIVL